MRVLRNIWVIFILLTLSTLPVNAQEVPGGVQQISGLAPYTFPYFRLFLPQPYIVLYDASGLISKDTKFVPAEASQVIGTITSDPFVSPFSYILNLPFRGSAQRIDVDNDGEQDSGINVYIVTVTSNTWNGPFLEQRDDFVTGVLSSSDISGEIDTFLDLKGGALVVYAEDDNQAFPSSAGADGLLFTSDDPSASLQAGWTVVFLDENGFRFERESVTTVDLREAEEAALDDLSDLSYVESFDGLIDLLKQKYAFTAYKGLDWEALRSEFRPRIQDAQNNRNNTAFRRALRDLSWRIPDGHVSGPAVAEDFQRDAAGGLGMVLRQLDDGRVLISQVLTNSAAANAGISPHTEIVSIDGTPVEAALAAVVPYTGPFSTPHNLRLEQLRFVARRQIGTPIQLSLKLPDGALQSTTLNAQFDSDGFYAGGLSEPLVGDELPVEFRLLENNIALISIFSFSDDLPLTVSLWERAIQRANAADVDGVIVDIRRNGGGSGYLGDQLPAYFFDTPHVIGNRAEYSALRGEFVINPLLEETFILPPRELRYSGPVAVLISPDCASACESFAWAMTIADRATIVGHYPTAGLGGSVKPIALPDGLNFSYTNSRSVDANGEINIEGKGVAPTLRIPVTEDSIFSTQDVLQQAAIDLLTGNSTIIANQQGIAPSEDAMVITVGGSAQGALAAGDVVRYSLQANAGQRLDIIASGEGELQRALKVTLYIPGNPRALDTNSGLRAGEPGAGFQNLSIPQDLTLMIEITAVDARFSGDFTLTVSETP
jgi:C-terminal processing protease CtpA/Prc